MLWQCKSIKIRLTTWSSKVPRQFDLLWKNKYIIQFCKWGGWGSHDSLFLVIVINICPVNGLKLQPIQLLEVAVSSSTSIQMLTATATVNIQTTTPAPHSPQSTDNQTKGPVTSSWHLIFHVKNIVAEQI